MPLSPIDRVNAIILAKSIVSTNAILDMKGELPKYIRRLHGYRLFTVQEISAIANVSEYLVSKALKGEEEFKAKSGIHVRHLDHLVRMISSDEFAKIHIKFLVGDGAKVSAISRVTGITERRLRYWLNKEG